MIAPLRLGLVMAASIALSGCCREALHMLALDTKAPAHAVKRRAVADDNGREKEAVKDAEATAGSSAVETGSLPDPGNCQGEHIAYQATKEYLKNFGPRPPDEPGEKGPCRPAR